MPDIVLLRKFPFILLLICSLFLSACGKKDSALADKAMAKANGELSDSTRGGHIQFFDEVYAMMDQEYYYPVTRGDLDQFVDRFKKSLYQELKDTGKSNNYVRWRSAAYLVDELINEKDTWSKFFPPKPAKAFEEEVLGVRIDLGIAGELMPLGYDISHVEPRSDAYQKGLRKHDILLTINEKVLKDLSQKEIEELLIPEVGDEVSLSFFDLSDRLERNIAVISKEYYKQTVFRIPLPVPDIYCLSVKRFNRKTSDDLLRFLTDLKSSGPIKGLILDFRGNPGGPPLAAREISAFFLEPGIQFAYFQKRGRPKSWLDVPTIDERFRYEGPMVLLVNEKSGSAAELFPGILQFRGRATVIGRSTAGMVLLKHMFFFKDRSMVALLTGRGHYPDGQVFSFDGLNPDRTTEVEGNEMIRLAAAYILKINNN